MLAGIKRFLYENYWLPIIDESVYYNPVNTITYALLFAALMIYFIPWFFEKLDLEFNRDLIVALTPYIFLGGGYFDTILLETPIIYIILISFALSMLAIGKKIEESYQDLRYSYVAGGAAVIMILIELILMDYSTLSGLSWFVITALLSLGIVYILLKTIKPEMSKKVDLIPIYAHFWDASSTFVVLNYGGEEKHVLADFFIQMMGPKGIFIMKGLVIFPAVLYMNKEFDGEERNYYLFLIALLGFALGTRNILSLITG
jgi:uncharacterized membrane protein